MPIQKPNVAGKFEKEADPLELVSQTAEHEVHATQISLERAEAGAILRPYRPFTKRGVSRCQRGMHFTRMTSSGGGVECDNVRRRVFKCQERGNLAVPERVDVRPFLFERAARRLDETALEPQDDDRVALRDELAGLELLKLEVFTDQGEELRDALAPAASAGKRYRGRALEGPLYVVGEEVQQRGDVTAINRLVGLLHHPRIRPHP